MGVATRPYSPPGVVAVFVLVFMPTIGKWLAPAKPGGPDWMVIDALHLGEILGAHAAFDFWPARSEVVIRCRDGREAINDRGITRLAVPDRSTRLVERCPMEEDAGPERISTRSSARRAVVSKRGVAMSLSANGLQTAPAQSRLRHRRHPEGRPPPRPDDQ